jgi:hypothetical protein
MWLGACAGVALLLLAGCARPSPVSAVDFPPIPPGSARIWFYRVYDPTKTKGRPYIFMNGAIVGISEQGYAFYRDVLAGLYHVSVESYGRDLFQFRDVALVAGRQAYVKILSLRSLVESGREFSRDTFYVLIVPPTFAQAEISHYPFLAAAEPSRAVASVSPTEVTAN